MLSLLFLFLPSQGPHTLIGKGITSGCNSHYVLTKHDGGIYQGKGSTFYDEIVIAQESQICPAFVLEINMSMLSDVVADFTRDAIAGSFSSSSDQFSHRFTGELPDSDGFYKSKKSEKRRKSKGTRKAVQ